MHGQAEAQTALSLDILARAALSARSSLEKILLPHDLTLDAWRVLHRLSVAGPLSMGALGETTRTTAPTLTRIVDRLVDRSLVYRNVDPADRRRLLIHASKRGLELQASLREPLQQAENAALIELSPAEIQTLRTLLERIG